jgi:hypothetical protein
MAASPFEDIGRRTYLVDQYVRAVGHMQQYAADYDKGKMPEARESLRRAAGAICEAFHTLSDDKGFWDSLSDLSKPVEENWREITRTLANVELFLEEEEKILLKAGFPPSAVRRLLDDLAISVTAFRGDFSPERVAALNAGIREVGDTICAMSRTPPPSESRTNGLDAAITAREGVSICGGLATIVGDALIAVPGHLIPLVSCVGGLASATGFLEWMRRRKQRRG